MPAFDEYRKPMIITSAKFDENKGHQGQGH